MKRIDWKPRAVNSLGLPFALRTLHASGSVPVCQRFAEIDKNTVGTPNPTGLVNVKAAIIHGYTVKKSRITRMIVNTLGLFPAFLGNKLTKLAAVALLLFFCCALSGKAVAENADEHFTIPDNANHAQSYDDSADEADQRIIGQSIQNLSDKNIHKETSRFDMGFFLGVIATLIVFLVIYTQNNKKTTR